MAFRVMSGDLFILPPLGVVVVTSLGEEIAIHVNYTNACELHEFMSIISISLVSMVMIVYCSDRRINVASFVNIFIYLQIDFKVISKF